MKAVPVDSVRQFLVNVNEYLNALNESLWGGSANASLGSQTNALSPDAAVRVLPVAVVSAASGGVSISGAPSASSPVSSAYQPPSPHRTPDPSGRTDTGQPTVEASPADGVPV